MIADFNLILATEEAVPNGGAVPGGLGGNSITGVSTTPYFIDMLRADNPLGDGIDQLPTSELELNVTITTAFGIGPNAMAEFQLVSLPINPTKLTPATTSGRRTYFLGASTAASDDSVTIAAHGLPRGTPVYLSALATTTGPTTNTLYYAVPLSADKFGLATSLANAVAGEIVTMTGNGTCTVEFFPYVHLTTGMIWGGFLGAGAQFIGRSIPGGPVGGGDHVAPYAGADALPLGAQVQPSTALGGGGGAATMAAPGRFLVPRVFVFNATVSTAGRYSMALGHAAGLGQRNYPIGSEIKSS